MPGLGHEPRCSLGVLLVPSRAPTVLFRATAAPAAELTLISSLLWFWQPKFPTRA